MIIWSLRTEDFVDHSRRITGNKPNKVLLAREMSSVIALDKMLFAHSKASCREIVACSRNSVKHCKIEVALVMSGAFVAPVSSFNEIRSSVVELADCDPRLRALLY